MTTVSYDSIVVNLTLKPEVAKEMAAAGTNSEKYRHTADNHFAFRPVLAIDGGEKLFPMAAGVPYGTDFTNGRTLEMDTYRFDSVDYTELLKPGVAFQAYLDDQHIGQGTVQRVLPRYQYDESDAERIVNELRGT